MDSTVKSRPNHYAVLGVRQSATREEIERAFLKQMFSPRPMAEVAQIGAAYEILRNPAKRRAYDASLGFKEEPPALLSKPVVAFSTKARYLAATPAITFDPPALEQPVSDGPPQVQSERAPSGAAQPQPDLETFLATARAEQEEGSAERPSEWRRPAGIAIGLVAAVGVAGAYAGSLAGSDVEAQEVTLPLPKAKPAINAPVQSPASAGSQASESRSPAAAPLRLAERRTQRPRSLPPAPGDRLASVRRSLHSYYETTGADGTPEIAAADVPAPPPALVAAASSAAVSMPLSNATIARTIHRIGYSCGEVASTAAVEGQAGVFNVTCTSGQSYQARPVRGRYRFKRVAQ
jgi:hypothetical protein